MAITGFEEPELLLVGAVPLRDAEEAITTVFTALGRHLRRIPDGETDERRIGIAWLHERLAAHPALEPDPDSAPLPGGSARTALPRLRLRPGADLADLDLDLGYAEAAKSYVQFAGLKRTGRLRPDLRFQVGLPTPLTLTGLLVSPGSRNAFLPLAERALLAELATIAGAIPHPELAVQWNAVEEVRLVAGTAEPWLEGAREQALAGLARLGAAVPEAVELGYHLCLDGPGLPALAPEDATSLVGLANGIAERVERAVQWIHMAVALERAGEAWFAPLGQLRLHPETRLVLGLIDERDGEAGNAERIAAARRVVPRFGLATPCGWGSRAAEAIPELLRLHAAAAAQMS